MKDSNNRDFRLEHEDGGPGFDRGSYKITWNSGKKTYSYQSSHGRHSYSSRKNPPPAPHEPPRTPAERPGPNQIRKKSIIPIGCVAAMWIGRALSGGLSSLGGIIRCAVLSMIVFAVLRLFFPDKLVDAPEVKPEAPKPEKTAAKEAPKPGSKPEPKPEPAAQTEKRKPTGNAELDEVLRQGEQSIAEIRRLNDEIPDFKISAQLKQLEILTGRIFSFVEQHPEDVRQIRQLLNYYLPTTIKLLQQYVVLQNQGMRMGNIDEGMQKIENMLDKVIVAFQKQLDSLFESDVVDITADVQVMEQLMASEGLVADKIEINRE